MGRGKWAVPAAVVAILACAGLAAAQIPKFFIGADAAKTGRIDLVVLAPAGSYVEVGELVGGQVRPLTTLTISPRGFETLEGAVTWRCDRLTRRFVATAYAPDGTQATPDFAIRTPSCRRRLSVSVPDATPPGRAVRVRIADRWRIGGVRPRLCVRGPRVRGSRVRERCQAVDVGAKRPAVSTFRPRTEGTWRIEVRIAGFRLRHSLRVGEGVRLPARPGPTLPLILATGDSTLQGIDRFLEERIAGTERVRSDIAVGTGISKPTGRDWLRHARRQAVRLHPAAAVISLGANEGFPLARAGGGRLACCGEPWVAEYVRRVRTMMRTYAQRRRAPVLWLKLPAPRESGQALVFTAVNTAIERAAAGLPAVRIVRLDDIFTPGAVYRPSIEHGGRRVRVRAGDGVHLSVAGQRIAADEVRRVLREP